MRNKAMVMRGPVEYLPYPVRIAAKHPPQGVENIEIPSRSKIGFECDSFSGWKFTHRGDNFREGGPSANATLLRK